MAASAGQRCEYKIHDERQGICTGDMPIILGERWRCKKGNYMAFFPSYKFMEAVYEQFVLTQEGIYVILQSQNMGEKEREEFLEEFDRERENSLIGFCVMGGVVFGRN